MGAFAGEGALVQVRELRLARGWSQLELAERSGLSVRTIQRIENGTAPGLESRRSLAAVFDVDVADLQPASTGRATPMSFDEAVRHCLTHYADFDGVGDRTEFWWFALAVTLAMALGAAIAPALGTVVAIVLLLPFLAAAARRVRDAGQSPWWLLILFAPVGGLVVVATLCAIPSTDERAPGREFRPS
jgi:transcriptional regulator with XRE-family HTH domain